MKFVLLTLSALLYSCSPDSQQQRWITRFAWPAETTVTVREEGEQLGQTGEMTYVLHIVPDQDGRGIVIRTEQFRFVSLDGLGSANQRDVLAEATAFASILPPFRVDDRGDFIDLVDVQKYLDTASQRATEAATSGGSQVAAAIDGFRTEQGTEALRRMMADRWAVWAQGWKDLQIEPGQTTVGESRAPTDSADTASTQFEFTCVEQLEWEGRDCVRMTWSSVTEGPELAASLDRALADESNDPRPRLADARLTREWEGVFELRTLCPQWVKTVTVRQFQTLTGVGDIEDIGHTEKRTYTFEWPE